MQHERKYLKHIRRVDSDSKRCVLALAGPWKTNVNTINQRLS